ncbi:MAG: diacylglycerol kinase family lipid kinase [Candidatus Aminicenantes bacterium]|nr:diacylglycerol kinase family lipid kinase [Candidatus Aminicenantes bacterium]
MSLNKVHVIVNPFSARGKTEKRWGKIKEIVKYYFKEYKYIFTEKPKQATKIVRKLLMEGFDLIIGVGGDGTLNEITNGFFQQHSFDTINEDASIGIIPSGTGSDFIRFLKIPREFEKSVELIKKSKTKKIDVGKITFNPESRDKKCQFFINIADFGLGAEVIKKLANIPSIKRGPLVYYKGLLLTLKNYKSKLVKIKMDESQEIEGKFLIGAIANGRIFGGGMMIAPNAEPDDGFFDLVLVEDMKKLEIIYNIPHLYRGTIAKNPKVFIHRVKKIEISSDEIVNIEYDGEIGRTLPATFEIIEKKIKLRI